MTVKGLLLDLLSALGVQPRGVAFEPGPASGAFDPANSAEVVIDGQAVGWIGQLSPEAQADYDLPSSTIVAELNFEPFLQQSSAVPFQPLARFPSVEEDLSLLMDEAAAVGPIIAALMAAGDGLVEQVTVSDVYRHASLGEHKKSPLLHIVYRAKDRTLSADEVTTIRQQLLAVLTKEGIDVRT
jgi:phenylalanyl-tRNA synthetase beta chain